MSHLDQLDKPGPTSSAAPLSERFLAGLTSYRQVTLLSHIHPDPDSLASMLGLAHLIGRCLNLRTRLTRDGTIGRAENRTMVDVLGIELVPLEAVAWSPDNALVMVDSQPGTGRHTIPEDLPLYAVIDHHQTEGRIAGIPFVDVRPDVGATSTIVASYLDEQHVELTPRVASALFYGIESELNGYPREACSLDDGFLVQLYPLVKKDLLAQIRNARLPQSYYEALLHALQDTFLYDRLIVSWAGELPQPELTAEIADLLLRHEQMEWSFCAGVFQDNLVMSIRTRAANGQAGRLLQTVVGGAGSAGGHDRRAGGTMPLPSTAPSAVEQCRAGLRRRLLQALGLDEHRGQRLVSRRELLQSLRT